jgi:hypothetical protein
MNAILTPAPDAQPRAHRLPGIRPQPAYARVGELLLRRLRYCAHFIYWSIRHRSFEHAGWICAYEGISWK